MANNSEDFKVGDIVCIKGTIVPRKIRLISKDGQIFHIGNGRLYHKDELEKMMIVQKYNIYKIN